MNDRTRRNSGGLVAEYGKSVLWLSLWFIDPAQAYFSFWSVLRSCLLVSSHECMEDELTVLLAQQCTDCFYLSCFGVWKPEAVSNSVSRQSRLIEVSAELICCEVCRLSKMLEAWP